jgi:SulP family sulfate permease
VEWVSLSELVSPAVSIALLAGIESLLSALVADGMTGRKHRSNAELVAQGFANIASPLFGGIPATGAIARTATNVKIGGRTPIAGIVHAVTLLFILMFGGKWAASIPMPALAGILLVVAYNISEWRVFSRMFRGTRSDVMVLLVTFLLTVFMDLTVAIQAGVVLAALLLMRRMADVTQVRSIKDQLRYGEGEDLERVTRLDSLADVELFEIHGSFCFGAAQKFSEVISRIESRPRVIVLRMRDVFAMDATGLHALEEVVDRFQSEDVALILTGVHAQPLGVMRRSGLIERIGTENVFGSFADAVTRAESISGTARSAAADAGAPG